LRAALTDSAERFSERAGELLAARPDHNVLATVLASVRSHPHHHPQALFATVENAAGDIVAAALRTPPRPLLASVMERQAAELLMDEWLRADPGLEGLTGPEPVASQLAAAWQRLTGRGVMATFDEAAYRLERVIPPVRPAPGSLRACHEADRELLVRWSTAFGHEAGVYADDADLFVERRLDHGGLFLWEDSGTAVSMVGVNLAVAGVVRLGPVYTPPERRNRGYASSAVAAASENALAADASACMLFADLANPTSNAIYSALGYERFADWREYELEPG
jgi:predicted GNAT family acetyltransferase